MYPFNKVSFAMVLSKRNLHSLAKHICTAGLAGCSAGPLSEIKTKFSFNLPVLGFLKRTSRDGSTVTKKISSYNGVQFQAHSKKDMSNTLLCQYVSQKPMLQYYEVVL